MKREQGGIYAALLILLSDRGVVDIHAPQQRSCMRTRGENPGVFSGNFLVEILAGDREAGENLLVSLHIVSELRRGEQEAISPYQFGRLNKYLPRRGPNRYVAAVSEICPEANQGPERENEWPLVRVEECHSAHTGREFRSRISSCQQIWPDSKRTKDPVKKNKQSVVEQKPLDLPGLSEVDTDLDKVSRQY